VRGSAQDDTKMRVAAEGGCPHTKKRGACGPALFWKPET
jgi:hypothetical protein